MPRGGTAFTPPPVAAQIAFHNEPLLYALLISAAAAVLVTPAANSKQLGARIGLPARPPHLDADTSPTCPLRRAERQRRAAEDPLRRRPLYSIGNALGVQRDSFHGECLHASQCV